MLFKWLVIKRFFIALMLSVSLFCFGGCASHVTDDAREAVLSVEDLTLNDEQLAEQFGRIFQRQSHTLRLDTEKPRKKRNAFTCTTFPIPALSRRLPNISISFMEADLREALVEISVVTQIPVVMDDLIDGLISVNFTDTRLDKALNIMLAGGRFEYRVHDDYIFVGSSTPDSPSFSSLAVSCRYKPFHTLPIDLASSLSPYYQQFIRVPQNSDYLTITAPVKIQKNIQNQLKTFDQAPEQVLLEMSIVEVSKEALKILGLNWRKFGRDPNTRQLRDMGVGEWDGVSSSSASELLRSFSVGLMPHRTLAESMRFLEQSGSAKIKAMPSIVSLDGREAIFSTTNSIWVVESPSSNRTRELVYGVEMNVTPRISSDGDITLRIAKASVSDLTETDQGQPQITSHSVSNTVTVKDGDFLILGGLLQSRKSKKVSGLPISTKMKGLDYLLRQSHTEHVETEVLIMIRPRILDRG